MRHDEKETGGETRAERERRFQRTLRNLLSTPPQPHETKEKQKESSRRRSERLSRQPKKDR